ncbi:replication initiation protein [Persicobacter diffluens]|uniref:Initiator Rep protein WH1 domain-containing protein n=1 Tax=Persicobacter diffluens TaxID=981 RepID=A0AAN4W5G7_9BACT|nr:hypothetical protein PEDI_55350 [Persicobacter diffluens]
MKEDYLDLMIVKSNKLIESKNHFSLIQQRIMSLALAKIPKDQEAFQWMNFGYADLFPEGSKIGGSQYKLVKSAIANMGSLSIFIQLENGKWHSIPFLQARGDDKTKIIEIKFVEDARDLLLNLKGNFTKYLVRSISKFESSYSFKIYELCKQYLKVGSRTCSVIFLRQRLGLLVNFEDKGQTEEELESLLSRGRIKTKYALFNNFNKRILEIAQQEINEHSDIHIEYEKVKKGTSVVAIKFLISKNASAGDETLTELAEEVQEGSDSVTKDISYEEVSGKEKYVDALMEQKKDKIKNPSAYKNTLMNSEALEKEYQQKQEENIRAQQEAEQENRLKLQEELIRQMEVRYGEEYKNVRVPYCKMAGESPGLIMEFRDWYAQHGSTTDKRSILEQIDNGNLSSSAWIKFGTFMIQKQGTAYEKQYFLSPNPKPWMEMKLKEHQQEQESNNKFNFSGF